LQFAKEYRVGHIVMGTPGRKIPLWKRLRGKVSIVERLITEGAGITVVVLDTKSIQEERPTLEATPPTDELRGGSQKRKDFDLKSDAALSRTTALVWEEPIEKEEAMRRLLDSCRGIGKRLRESAWESVLEREQQGGTFVGEDVAIPHALIAGLSRPLMAIGVGRGGIQDQEAGRKIRIMMMLLSPVDPPESHLEMLEVISRMAREDKWRKEVFFATKSADIINAIKEWEIRFGATNK
ncbi:MAG: PTS sugar transporter subunit IIA, partial [Desulfobacterales bacterium]